MRSITVVAVVAGTLAATAIAPTVKLKRDEVEVAVPSADLMALLRRRFTDSPDDVLALQDDRAVRRFSGRAGPFPYRTVELVTFGPDWITFDHLAGPFSHCHERFTFTDHGGSTTVAHTGEFRLRGGIWSALLAVGPVRRAFETHVHDHMVEMALMVSDQSDATPSSSHKSQ